MLILIIGMGLRATSAFSPPTHIGAPAQAQDAASKPTTTYGDYIKAISGPQTTLAILVEFADTPHKESKATIDSLIFKDMADFYAKVSYGRIQIVGETIGWFRLPEDMAYYGEDRNPVIEGSDGRAAELLSDAVIAAQDYGVDFTNYSQIMVVHAGVGQEDEPRNQTLLWSVAYWQGLAFHTRDGTIIRSAALVPEMEAEGHSPLGTYAHEYGHLLGLPDLYDFNSAKKANATDPFIGVWSLMGTGLWLGDPQGSSPSELEAWSRIKLGWLIPDAVTLAARNASFQLSNLRPLETSTGNRALQIPTDSGQYYLVEFRRKIGWDRNLPSEGILVTKIDEFRPSGGGIVRVVDDNPETKTLSDATFRIGSNFTDTRDHIFISILPGPANSFSVLVGNADPASLPLQYARLNTADHLNATYSQPASLSGKLTDLSGRALAGLPVKLQYYGDGRWNDLAFSTTDQQGVADFVQNFPFNPGEYQLRLYFPGGKIGGKYFAAADETTRLFLRKIATSIELRGPQGVLATQENTFTVNVSDEFNRPLKDLRMLVWVDGKLIQNERITNSTIVITINFPLYQIGRHTIKIEVQGNSIYTGSSESQDLEVWAPDWVYLALGSVAAVGLTAGLIFRRRRRRQH